MSIFNKSQFIWAEGCVASRNQFISFEQHIDTTSTRAVTIHLFADTRFRLWVNESFVAYGPGRFVTQFPEYDSYDLAPYLKAGENLVRVEVNYYGSDSFQTMPDGQPGFIAAGGSGDGAVDFATPGDWQARRHTAWDADAAHFSFAQNPAEICDTRILSAELQDDAKVLPVHQLPEEECPWGQLTARSAPYPDYASCEPEHFELAAPLKPSRIVGLQSVQNDFKPKAPRRKRAVATWIHSPVQQTISLSCFWSEIRCNGERIEADTDTPLGNHGIAPLPLKQGWNFLTASFEVLTAVWSYLLRPEHGANVSFHAIPELDCESALAASIISLEEPPLPEFRIPYSLPEGWSLESGDPVSLTPARVMAWDESDESAARRKIPYSALASVAAQNAREATWCVKFDLEYYGQPVIEVEAPAGSILDLAYDDWLRPDGCLNLYVSNPFTDTADRFILRGGRQRIEVLNPRGGIYLQATLRAPMDSEPTTLKLHQVYIRRRTTIQSIEGSIQTGRSAFDYAWDASVNTLVASTDEAYSDCPWRERGTYIGDSVVGFQVDRLVNTDLSVARRTFLNFGRAPLADGQLRSCAPSCISHTHEDFSLLWIVGVRDYWSATGDVSFIEENWMPILGVLNAPWEGHKSGLWNAIGRNLFIDWGALKIDREGTANSAINMARFGALQAAAQMARVIGREEEASSLEATAEAVKSALLKHLWNPKEGRFHASLSDSESPALHANIWALFFRVGESEPLLNHVVPLLRKNFKQGVEQGQWSGHAELYFLYYAFTALGALGQHELVEQLIEEHYGFLESLNYGTLNECFCRAAIGQGSCCHTWSSAGAIYAHQYVLGLRQTDAGDPNNWLLDPQTTDRFHTISGSLAHSSGQIAISWERVDGVIAATVEAPGDVSIEAGANVELTRTDSARS